MFSIVSDRFLSVADEFVSSRLHMTFQRQLTSMYRIEWLTFLQKFQHFSLSEQLDDRLIWRWSQDDHFMAQSFYKWLEFGEKLNSEYDTIWKSHLPLKI